MCVCVCVVVVGGGGGARLILRGGPLERDAVVGGTESGGISGVTGVADGDVEEKAFEFW